MMGVAQLHTYTLTEIDEQLTVIVNIIKFSRNRNKVHCFKQADKWLDRRNEVVSRTNG